MHGPVERQHAVMRLQVASLHFHGPPQMLGRHLDLRGSLCTSSMFVMMATHMQLLDLRRLQFDCLLQLLQVLHSSLNGSAALLELLHLQGTHLGWSQAG